jgi:hypothetical protein
MLNHRADRAVSDTSKQDRVAGCNAAGETDFSQSLTAAIDAWAEAHHMRRSDAIRRLVEIGLKVAPAEKAHRTVRLQSGEIEGNAVTQISSLLDPSLPADERERRIRRLTEGPPEFADHRHDLPTHGE